MEREKCAGLRKFKNHLINEYAKLQKDKVEGSRLQTIKIIKRLINNHVEDKFS